ncbi:MAG: insulinase family protein [Bacteroidaceae bacterium]|nr:insulinase family protein [Bacteroidaceae bacterium]
MKKLNLIVILLAMWSVFPAMAQMVQQLPLDPNVRYGRLENGLTYYIRHNAKQEGLANFYIAQKVGAVQEEDSQRGLAHFLEHMCFNGSEHFPGSDDLVKYCESIGVKFGLNLNAYTASDETVYNINDVPVTPENVQNVMYILYDWANGLILDEKEIDKERGVIKEEWRMRSSANMRIIERNLPKLYPGSRYGYRLPIGTMEVIENFAYDELRAYYHKWYRPDLQGLIIVGDIDVDAIENQIKALFAGIKMPENPAEYVSYPVPDNNEPIYVIDKDKEMSQGIVNIYFKQDILPVEQRNSQLELVMSYMQRLVVSMLNARLDELSQKPDCNFLYAGVHYGNFILAKTKDAFSLTVLPKPGQDAEAVQQAVAEVERAVRFGFTGTEAFRANEKLISGIERLYDNRTKQDNEYYVQQYVRHFLDNTSAMDIEQEFPIWKQLTSAVPAEAFSQYLAQGIKTDVDTNFVLLAMYPEKDGVVVPTVETIKKAVETGKTCELTPYVDNVKNEPLVPELPQKGSVVKEEAADFGYTKWTLSNGAQVYFKQTDFNDAQILFSARSFGGMAYVPDADVLNARLLSDVASSVGMGNFTATELQKKLAGKQVRTGISLGEITDNIGGASTPKDLRTLFELLYLTFSTPANDVDAFANFMNNMRTSLANAEKQPTKAFGDSIQSTLYPGVARKKSISLADLDKVSYDEIRRIQQDRFKSPSDFNFYFTGALNVDSLRLFAETYLASIPTAGKRETMKDLGINMVKKQVENRFYREMETPQAYVLQVWHGKAKHTLKDELIVSTFGDILDQRYLKSIREDGGLSYSVSSSASLNYGLKDEFVLQTVCPFTPEKADSVLLLMQLGIEEIAQNGVTEDELNKVKAYELKNFKDNQTKNEYWHSLIAAKVDFGKNQNENYEELVKNITSKDIQTFAKKYLLKQNNRASIIMLPASVKP